MCKKNAVCKVGYKSYCDGIMQVYIPKQCAGGNLLFFTKSKQKKISIVNKEGRTKLNVPHSVENQVKMIGMTIEDLRIIHNLQPFVIEEIDDIVNRFYENLNNEPSLLHIIQDKSSIDRLKIGRAHV